MKVTNILMADGLSRDLGTRRVTLFGIMTYVRVHEAGSVLPRLGFYIDFAADDSEVGHQLTCEIRLRCGDLSPIVPVSMTVDVVGDISFCIHNIRLVDSTPITCEVWQHDNCIASRSIPVFIGPPKQD